MEDFLYKILDFGKRFNPAIDKTRLKVVEDNLNPKFEIRPYQEIAFSRFAYLYNNAFEGKPVPPYHLLYNMATGSGKTLIMAGLILYLYEKGYRNFLFFVHSNNIIEKTKDNFLNVGSSKYLFNEKIVINDKEVFIKTVENLDEADEENINIKFTTVQKLHGDLENPREDSITYEDLEGQKLVLLGDEAHHLSSGTKRKNGKLFGSWEDTVLKILKANDDNILLEFTATLDYDSREINEKYKNKVIFKYDLKHFREDKYSKEINIVRSLYDEKERILQALILNQYRQRLAAKYHINLKPVILFKAKRTIAESELNKTNFHQLIDNLRREQVEKIKNESRVEVVQRAFRFFETNEIRLENITEQIKKDFRPEFCISANNDAEAERNQMILNSLEDDDNPVRAVFAVQKLNEGWDVLNLFDIVRLYEDRDSKGKKLGKTTIAEAQLIGRGARYFPFKLKESQDKYKRKYDEVKSTDIDNLKILEELFYHTKEDSKYITEIKQALVETGAMADDRNVTEVKIKIKDSFKETELYKKGAVFINSRKPSDNKDIRSFKDFNLSLQNITFQMSSGTGRMTNVFNTKTESIAVNLGIRDVQLSEIPKHIVRFALTKNPFFYFDKLKKRFPHLKSLSDFMTNENYLGGLAITFKGKSEQVNHIDNSTYLSAVLSLLSQLQEEIKGNTVRYKGTAFKAVAINKVFQDKTLLISKDSDKLDGQKDFVEAKDWYVYDANHGTSEEKAFVEMFEARYEGLEKKYEDIYILRNERFFGIFDKNGQRFEPDFVLYAKQKVEKEPITYQVFIEPKGRHLVLHDKWKAEFLEDLRQKAAVLEFNTNKYKIIGLPFYNVSIANNFKADLEKTL